MIFFSCFKYLFCILLLLLIPLPVKAAPALVVHLVDPEAVADPGLPCHLLVLVLVEPGHDVYLAPRTVDCRTLGIPNRWNTRLTKTKTTAFAVQYSICIVPYSITTRTTYSIPPVHHTVHNRLTH